MATMCRPVGTLLCAWLECWRAGESPRPHIRARPHRTMHAGWLPLAGGVPAIPLSFFPRSFKYIIMLTVEL